jgi:thiaminase
VRDHGPNLRGYAKALAACAAKAPDQDATVRPTRYARWIALYGGEAFQAVVDAVLAETDRVGATLSPAELDLMREHFTTTSRYEWMFWDAGWRCEAWPV